MDGRTDTGVKGFFSEYGKATPMKAKPVQVEQPAEPVTKPATVPVKTTATKKRQRVRARTGRPPGVASGTRSYKIKASMHVSAELIDYYRDWSWDARCTLGELIERAMVAYKSSRNAPANRKVTRT
jgi:hypothetical protein